MERRSNASPWLIAAVVVAALAALGVGVWAFLRWLRKPLVAVPRVDLDRFAGSWHTIAAMPAGSRRATDGAALRITHMGDGLLQVAHLTAGGRGTRQVRATAVADRAGSSLDLSGGGPLGRKLVVLSISPDYDACIVGSPDRKRAWILSRRQELSRTLWRFFREELARQGFNVERLRQAPGTRVRMDTWSGAAVTPPRDPQERKLDEALDDTFPASDPPSTWGRAPAQADASEKLGDHEDGEDGEDGEDVGAGASGA